MMFDGMYTELKYAIMPLGSEHSIHNHDHNVHCTNRIENPKRERDRNTHTKYSSMNRNKGILKFKERKKYQESMQIMANRCIKNCCDLHQL